MCAELSVLVKQMYIFKKKKNMCLVEKEARRAFSMNALTSLSAGKLASTLTTLNKSAVNMDRVAAEGMKVVASTQDVAKKVTDNLPKLAVLFAAVYLTIKFLSSLQSDIVFPAIANALPASMSGDNVPLNTRSFVATAVQVGVFVPVLIGLWFYVSRP